MKESRLGLGLGPRSGQSERDGERDRDRDSVGEQIMLGCREKKGTVDGF